MSEIYRFKKVSPLRHDFETIVAEEVALNGGFDAKSAKIMSKKLNNRFWARAKKVVGAPLTEEEEQWKIPNETSPSQLAYSFAKSKEGKLMDVDAKMVKFEGRNKKKRKE